MNKEAAKALFCNAMRVHVIGHMVAAVTGGAPLDYQIDKIVEMIWNAGAIASGQRLHDFTEDELVAELERRKSPKSEGT